jgi:hypothetical protein
MDTVYSRRRVHKNLRNGTGAIGHRKLLMASVMDSGLAALLALSHGTCELRKD